MPNSPVLCAALLFSLSLPGHARAQYVAPCALCGPGDAAPGRSERANPGRALRIQIESNLEFGVAAVGPDGTGTIAIDPRTDQRTVSGTLIDLGGAAFSGVARLSGEPFARVSIRLPDSDRLMAPRGASLQITGFVTDAPRTATLDANGDLLVRFGGRLLVTGGQTGDFRGRIVIMADYE